MSVANFYLECYDIKEVRNVDKEKLIMLFDEIPDVRDGLTPKLRHALNIMQSVSFKNKGHFVKTSTIAGLVSEKLNIDIEDAYEVFVNLTYPRCKIPLVEGHGNMGFPPAYMTFSEMRISSACAISSDVNTPMCSIVPYVLSNGTLLSMYNKTKIPSHNLGELIDASIAVLKEPDIITKDLLNYIKGPDLLIGGEIINKDDLYEIYEKGYGEIKIKVTPETVNYRWFDDADDYCDWYELEIEQRENEQIISIPYNALLFDGKSTKHMSLKEILQCHLTNCNNRMTVEELCKEFEKLKLLTKKRLTRC